MKITTRLARTGDIDTLFQMNMREYFPDGQQDIDLQTRYIRGLWWADLELFHWYYNLLLSCSGGILIALEGTRIVGQLDFVRTKEIHFNEAKGRVHILWLLVDVSFRRVGVAEELTRTLVELVNEIVWVEDEDQRSKNLYLKLGRPIVKILNYSCPDSDIGSTGDTLPLVQPVTLSDLFTISQSGILLTIIGNYYTQNFDIAQLAFPDNKGMILGQLPQPQVFRYDMQNGSIYAIITQYLRVYLSGKMDMTFPHILTDIITRVAKIGFESIELQFYNTSPIALHLQEIEKLGFELVSENDDVFELAKKSVD